MLKTGPNYFSALVMIASCAVSAQESAEEQNTTHSSEDNREAMAELPEGRFEILTDKFFQVSQPHVSEKISFRGLSDWERRVSGTHGFDYAFVNAPIAQIGSEGGKTYADNEMDLYLQWRINTGSNSEGKLFFWGTYVQTFSSLANGEFSRSQGLITSTISAGTDPDKSFVAPSALWWQQSFNNSGFLYRTGQLYATSLWGNNKYTFDDREGFMNSVLSSNIGLPWSDTPRGLGVMVQQTIGSAYVSLGIQDAKAKQDQIDVDSFLDGKYLYTGELGYNTNIGSDHEGRYKISLGYVDGTAGTAEAQTESNASGWGLALSARQDLGDIGLFAQYRRSLSDRIAQGIKTSANAGVVFNKPLGFSDDALGIGLLYASSSDEAERDEYGGEIYWRFQMTPRLDITPDIQIYRPGQPDQSGITVVGAFRFRYVL